MTAIYLSVVSIVNLADQLVWRCPVDFFEYMVTGWKKHLSLMSRRLHKTQKSNKKTQKMVEKWIATGRAYTMCLIYSLVQKLTTNICMEGN